MYVKYVNVRNNQQIKITGTKVACAFLTHVLNAFAVSGICQLFTSSLYYCGVLVCLKILKFRECMYFSHSSMSVKYQKQIQI